MSIKKIDRIYLNFIIAISVFVALYLISQNWKTQLVLHDVKVYDASILTDNEVKTLADVHGGTALYKIKLAQIANRIEQNPFVRKAIVVRAFPYDLTITLRERDPIALLALAPPSGMLSIDKDGIVLPLPLGRKNNLPLITDVVEKLEVGDTVNGAMMQVVKFISDADKIGTWLGAEIAEVKLDGDNLIAYTTDASLPIIIGKNGLHRKIIYLESFLKEFSDNGNPSYSYVDLRFNGEIVVGQNTETGNWKPDAGGKN